MGKISMDISSIKAAGVYTLEIDNSQRTTVSTQAVRLIPGFSEKGPFNRPVLLETDADRLSVFGDVDTKMEHKGCYFNRMLRTMLEQGPVIALNLLNVDKTEKGPDQVNYSAFSLSAGTANPTIGAKMTKYAEYDYAASDGSYIKNVGTTPFAGLYNRSRFWIPDKDLLTAAANRGLGYEDTGTYEFSNLLNFANVGTSEMSILVFKPTSVPGFELTAESFYKGRNNIPFGWIRPQDFISDYFLTVVAVKGNWTNYQVLASDPVWSAYFNKTGFIKEKLNSFLTAEGVTVIGSWTGSIIPDFTDGQGNNVNLERKVNNNVEKTGLLMSFNEDAAQILTYDYTGVDNTPGCEDDIAKGSWGYDIDGDNEVTALEGGKARYIVDMVGHEIMMDKELAYNILVDAEDVTADEQARLIPSAPSDDQLINVTSTGDIPKIKTIDSLISPLYSIVYLHSYTEPIPDTPVEGQYDFAITNHEHVYVVTVTVGEEEIVLNVLEGADEELSGSYVVTGLDLENTAAQEVTLTRDGVEKTLTITVSKHTVSKEGTRAITNVIVRKNGTSEFYAFDYVLETEGRKKTASIEPISLTKADLNPEVCNIPTSLLEVWGTFNHVKVTIKHTEETVLAYFMIDEDPENTDVEEDSETQSEAKIQFLSYNVDVKEYTLPHAYQFADLFAEDEDHPACPVEAESNMFIIAERRDNEGNDIWSDDRLKVGDFVRNRTYENIDGEVEKYDIIPGITRIIEKRFIQINNGEFTYKGKTYKANTSIPGSVAQNGNTGVYLYTCTEKMLLKPILGGSGNSVYVQKSINETAETLQFIPMRGLQISSRHRPGYDAEGNISIEGGIEKIYKVLEDEGIRAGLCNKVMVDYRYIVDSMSFGLDTALGGKRYIAELAKDRGKCTALLNLPSAKQFMVSKNPIFCDTYVPGVDLRPPFNVKYIAQGGNSEMGSTKIFSLPNEDSGAKYAAAFWPNLIYSENGKEFPVPPAADVSNVFYRKYDGISDQYAIMANMDGIINNRRVKGLEFEADDNDRAYLEPFGVNTIIKDKNGNIKVFGNQTCYQERKSDFNKLHVRENLNTIEIECEAILELFNFKYNTPATRAKVYEQIVPIFNVMMRAGALADATVTCDETNNTPDVIAESGFVITYEVTFNMGMEKILQVIKVNRSGDITLS